MGVEKVQWETAKVNCRFKCERKRIQSAKAKREVETALRGSIEKSDKKK